MRIPCEEVGR